MKTRQITAGVLAAALVASLGVLLLKSDDTNPGATPTGSASPTVEGSPDPSQGTYSTPTCDPDAPDASGELLLDLESRDDATLIRGEADLSIDPEDPHEGAGSLRISTRATPATVRATFAAPLDVQSRTLTVWLRHNGNVSPGGLDLRVRLHSDADNSFERVLQPIDVTAAMRWCRLPLDLASLHINGRPDPSRIRWLEVSVPAGMRPAPGQPRPPIAVWLDETRG